MLPLTNKKVRCVLLVLLLAACDSSVEPGHIDNGIDTDANSNSNSQTDSESPVDSSSGQPLAGLVFETNFENDTGYAVSNIGLWNGGVNNVIQPPGGWDGVLATAASSVRVLSGQGVNGSNALKLDWDPNISQPTVSLGKHLTGNASTGFDELFIRYHVRLPNRFKAGDDAHFIPYWKWGRLWQNTTIDITVNGLALGNWTENRVDSKYVVWNFGGAIPYTGVNVVWGENTGDSLQFGSSGGERQGLDYFVSGSDQHVSPGYFESLWDINETDRLAELQNNTAQPWHIIEYRFKLASSATADDGEFQMWWNGVDQGPYSRIGGGGGAPNRNGIPTSRDGSGFNYFTFFDNMTGWNRDWGDDGVEGGIYVNDVVVSTDYIGTDYIAGNVDNVFRE